MCSHVPTQCSRCVFCSAQTIYGIVPCSTRLNIAVNIRTASNCGCCLGTVACLCLYRYSGCVCFCFWFCVVVPLVRRGHPPAVQRRLQSKLLGLLSSWLTRSYGGSAPISGTKNSSCMPFIRFINSITTAAVLVRNGSLCIHLLFVYLLRTLPSTAYCFTAKIQANLLQFTL